MLPGAHSARVRERPVLLMNAQCEMCHLAWLNWMMLNLFALSEWGGGAETDAWMEWGWEGLMDSEWEEKVCVCMCVYMCVSTGEGGGWLSFLTYPPAGPPVNVAMAIEVASIDHISEANMVMYSVLLSSPSIMPSSLQQRSKICYLHNPDLSHLRVWKHCVWTCVLSCLIS